MMEPGQLTDILRQDTLDMLSEMETNHANSNTSFAQVLDDREPKDNSSSADIYSTYTQSILSGNDALLDDVETKQEYEGRKPYIDKWRSSLQNDPHTSRDAFRSFLENAFLGDIKPESIDKAELLDRYIQYLGIRGEVDTDLIPILREFKGKGCLDHLTTFFIMQYFDFWVDAIIEEIAQEHDPLPHSLTHLPESDIAKRKRNDASSISSISSSRYSSIPRSHIKLIQFEKALVLPTRENCHTAAFPSCQSLSCKYLRSLL